MDGPKVSISKSSYHSIENCNKLLLLARQKQIFTSISLAFLGLPRLFFLILSARSLSSSGPDDSGVSFFEASTAGLSSELDSIRIFFLKLIINLNCFSNYFFFRAFGYTVDFRFNQGVGKSEFLLKWKILLKQHLLKF